MRVPLCIPAITDEEISAVIEVLKSGWLAHGPKNHELEKQFIECTGAKHAIAMNSCTSALYAAVVGMDIKGEVIVPSFTFVASVNAILLAGATPVYVDVDTDTRNVTAELIEPAITDKTEAIMVVHYAGLPCDMPSIIALAEKHDLRIIEDSAETLGAHYPVGRHPGHHDVGCFSFFPTKNITTGEGGMLTTNDDALAAKMKAFIAHGIDSTTYAREKAAKPWLRIAQSPGFNFRMSNLLAAIGVEQMKRLDQLVERRNDAAKLYVEQLSDVSWVSLPVIPEGFTHSWQMFTILVAGDERDAFLAHLRSKEVGASVHFDPPVHQMPAYAEIRRADSLPNTDKLVTQIVTLPMYPSMTGDNVDHVCNAIKSFKP
jgi:perosamine synthetase